MTRANDFDAIYSTYAAAVYRVCLRAVSHTEVAEELTGEVFLHFFRERHKVSEEQLPDWLFTVARQRAAGHWRRHYDAEQLWPVAQAGNEFLVDDPELSLDLLLARCVALRQVHRVCLVLRFRHAMSRAEIARHIGLSELQVKGHLQQALQLLRKFIGQRRTEDAVAVEATPADAASHA